MDQLVSAPAPGLGLFRQDQRLASSCAVTVSSGTDARVLWLSPPGLRSLSYELMANIAMRLSIEEVFDLSLCCRHFQYIITKDSFLNDCRYLYMIHRTKKTGKQAGPTYQSTKTHSTGQSGTSTPDKASGSGHCRRAAKAASQERFKFHPSVMQPKSLVSR